MLGKLIFAVLVTSVIIPSLRVAPLIVALLKSRVVFLLLLSIRFMLFILNNGVASETLPIYLTFEPG